jgi:hypothetical protein
MTAVNMFTGKNSDMLVTEILSNICIRSYVNDDVIVEYWTSVGSRSKGVYVISETF